MLKALLISEKPSLTQAIKEGYSKHPNKQFDITYCSCAGHIMELYMPGDYCEEWKKWDANMLPIIPSKFKTKVTKEGERRYKIIKDNFSVPYDVIINAGDPGREGELIIDEVIASLNQEKKIPEYRLWLDDLTTEGIIKGFDNIIKQPQYNLKKAAYLRQWNDFLIGINGSRAITLSTGCGTIAVGRVMSVVLNMIVVRDRLRESFEPEPYYECRVTMRKGKDEFTGMLLKDHKEIKFERPEEIQTIMNGAVEEGVVVSIKRETKSTEPPLLLNLAELQKVAFATYGYSPDIVLASAQSLYEKRLLSYPRTDCRYISENVANELERNLRALATIPEYSSEVSRIISDVSIMSSICKHENKYVDNSKLTDHHALIVTAKPPVFADLKEEEQNIYKLVANSLIGIFSQPRIVCKTNIVSQFGKAMILSEGKTVLQEGYSKFIPVKSNDKMLPVLEEGDELTLTGIEGLEKETKPPAFYNFKSLLEDMENCGKYADGKENVNALKEVKGIGQASTRDSIINKVISLGYVKLVGKGSKSHLESTEVGRYIIDLLQGTELISVDTTAKMELKLMGVEKGTYDANTFYLEMLEDVRTITKQLLELPPASEDNPLKSVNGKKKSRSEDTLLICPKCGHKILESDKGFFCEGYKDKSCDLYYVKTLCGANITKQEFSNMLAGNKITKNFKWKSGKRSNAMLGIENHQYQFYFNK